MRIVIDAARDSLERECCPEVESSGIVAECVISEYHPEYRPRVSSLSLTRNIVPWCCSSSTESSRNTKWTIERSATANVR